MSEPDCTANATVAANMRRFRKQLGWTGAELGEKLGGWSKAVVSAAERSDAGTRVRSFSIDDVVLIASVLGVTVTDLITPVPPCPCCGDKPAPGMACTVCGAAGDAFVTRHE